MSAVFSGKREPAGLRPARGYLDINWASSSLSGWILHPDLELTSVEVYRDQQKLVTAPLENAPDIAAFYPRISHAARSRFEIRLSPEFAQSRDPHRLFTVGYGNGGALAGFQTILFPAEMLPNVPAPTPDLIAKVQGGSDAGAYRMLGFRYYNQLLETIARQRDLTSVGRFLDWACGSGRITAYLSLDSHHWEVHGCDIDADAIRWANRNLTGTTFMQSAANPPLPYPEMYFDVVIALGIFAGFDAEREAAWLEELRRVLAPQGLLLVSTQGRFGASFLFPHDFRDQLQLAGILNGTDHPQPDDPSGTWRGYFRTPEYIARVWSKYLDVVDHLEGEINADQDLIVLRRA